MGTNLSQGIKLEQEALKNMKIASALNFAGEDERAADFQIEATYNDAAAQQLFACISPPRVIAGELVITETERPDGNGGWALRDTLASPDAASIQASIERTDLLTQGHTDILAMGIDAAHSADCHNSLEKMLAHQMALAHQSAFKVIDQALQQRSSVETARLINAGAKLMTVYQQGLLALHRIKNGGNQTVTVQHVTVNGGQTLVAGSMQHGGKPTLPGGEK